MRIGKSAAEVSRLLEAVADENRLRILKCLQVRPACVCELVQATGMAQPKVSRHLKVLREVGLVSDARDAQWVEYSLVQAPEGAPEAELLALIASWLTRDPQVREDLRRYKTASREQCTSPGDEGQ
jgi:ArsR family transcriptional regulator